MDTEQQLRLHFLDEAEDCLDRMESIVLGLSAMIAEPQQLDQALRAAHSVKGGAAMMGFTPLSQVAHHMEDYLKILRVRYATTLIETDVETLLLQGIDCLRQVSNLHRQAEPVTESWLSQQADPIFAHLRDRLGDLQSEDEDALLADNDTIDPALFLFENGVEASLHRLESQINHLKGQQLRQELAATADELAEFGRMAQLNAFVQLCLGVQSQIQEAPPEHVDVLVPQALATWRRSHALVQLGRVDELPSVLDGAEVDQPSSAVAIPDWDDGTMLDLDAIAGFDLNLDISLDADLGAVEMSDSEIPAFADVESPAEFDGILNDLDMDALALDAAELQAAFSAADDDHPAQVTSVVEAPAPIASVTPASPQSAPKKDVSRPAIARTVRVPVEHLQKTNTLLGDLILERNAINLRLEQMQMVTTLFAERMRRLEQSNLELRQWYDQASLDGIVPTSGSSATGSGPSSRPSSEAFDALEMDRYTDLHLISQAQIETIVQLQEAGADITLGLREMAQSVRELNQTSRVLQRNVVRTQMLPFADVVKRFPRVVRDLSLQYGKQVSLKLDGEATLIDRSMLEALADPLTHLLRNAFDHGIESPDVRLAAQKPAEGTITLQAAHRGGQTVITIRDDGKGIDLEKIRQRLRQMGLPDSQIDAMSPAELLNWIFEPGFSTASQVTELSGRGVGMDIVRTNLRDIRGDIHVDTQLGVGTTFTLRIPFALSILRVMLLERAGIVFAVSTDTIQEVLQLQPGAVMTREGGDYLTWQARSIPLLRIEQELTFRRVCKRFELPGTPKINQTTALLVGEGSQVRGFYLDRVWGEQEVAIRPISSPIPLPPGFGQSVILGDGRVLPLIDPISLAESIEADQSVSQRQAQALAVDLPPIASTDHQVTTILVVDDSINVRRYLALTLEKAGYQVEQAKDGQDAVEKLIGGINVQAVICDIEMPRLDGYGVLSALRSKPAFHTLPIAMLTSRSSEKHRKLAMNLGASAYFSKPYTEQELLQSIKQLIQA
jgi:two-component system, chemotaxis family, sensor histidine kinase and response regulator PixL